MADYRRYQPRRTSSQSGNWKRWLVVAGVAVVLILIGKFVWGGKKTPTETSNVSNTTSADISLVTDNTNAATNTAVNANANANTNTATTTLVTGWSNFSATSCTKAISSFGTTKRVVLTVGFSAANDSVTQTIASLKSAGVPADFFTSGSFATKNPGVVKAATDAGFPVYSQSFDSTDLTTLSDADVTTAITKTETAIVDATGLTPKPIFRPPAGSYTTNTLKLLRAKGYCAVLWTVDAYDWQDGITVDQAMERVMTAVNKQAGGSIVALHAGYDITPQLITDLVAALKTAGYEIVSLSAAINS